MGDLKPVFEPAATVDVATMLARLTAARAGYLDNINNANLATIPVISAARIGYLDNINNANLANIADISSLTATEIAHLDADISSITPLTAGQVLSAITDDDTKLDGSHLNAITALNYPIFDWSALPSDHFQEITGDWARQVGAAYWSGAILSNSVTPVVNDNVAIGVVFVPITGTYTAHLIYSQGDSRGKAHFLLNNIDKGNIDMWGGDDQNVIDDVSLGSLTAGFYALDIKISDKNAGSSGYLARLQGVVIVKT